MAKLGKVSYPEWTEYRKKNGLDPLGMQAASVQLYQKLLPGISNVTLRVRYYGLYAWLAREYAKRVGDTDPIKWQRYVRRAEALYALVAERKGSETGVAGIKWAKRTLEARRGKEINFSADAEPGSPSYYLRQAWGAYGAAYASQVFEIGIFAEAVSHDIPVPSEGLGDDTAAAFDDSLGKLGKLFISAVGDGRVSRSFLDRLAPITPSGIPSNGDERSIYESILFAKAGPRRSPDFDRRESLMLLLALSGHTGGSPSASQVRWMLYAGYDYRERAIDFAGEQQEAHRLRWWVYQANDLLHVCYEGLLKFSLDVLGEYPAGISLPRLIGECSSRLSDARKKKPRDWAAFRKDNPPPENCLHPGDRTGEFHLQAELLRGTRPKVLSGPEHAWLALRLLAVLHNRIEASAKDPAEELRGVRHDVLHTLVTEIRFLDANKGRDFPEFIARLFEERVIRRHLWVGLRKFRSQRDYTFLIESDEGRVRLRAVDGPVFTNPRLGPALTFLKDIHLVDGKGLTARGKKLVREAQ